MHTRRSVALLILLVLVAGPLAEGADPVEVTGQVLDAAGKPLQGAEVAVGWTSDGDRWKARKSVRTDAEGTFSFEHRFFSRAHSLMVFDESQEHGAIVTLDEEAAKAPLVLKLRPTSLVRAAYTNECLGQPLEKSDRLVHGAAGEASRLPATGARPPSPCGYRPATTA